MSSQAIRSAEFRVSMPRRVISARLPIGVGTKEIEGAAGSSGMVEVYRSDHRAGRPERNDPLLLFCLFRRGDLWDSKQVLVGGSRP